ncbi:peptidase U32 family protein [Ammoniphilus sp. CFH 90114]|uniref:peptidase U32 family protein n=1 Tax=Ammoniphilus sp. CFH 90114 TaxID=2493665 RepID=UPI00100EB1FB|nr:peptidase U32 family protein [Ammoniphilus sp. CFH 90114]RXT14777.1 U32 family peptidase [Ammoniphilus sp. CFH 90114]
MKKPELLITAGNLNEVKQYLDAGADAVTIGIEEYGLRLPGSLTSEEMKEAVAYAHARNRKVYAAVNALLHNDKLEGLAKYLEELRALGVDAIEYADPAVLMTARKVTPDMPLHWNAEIIATSINTISYWASKGIKRAVISRELNMEEILQIKEESEVEIETQVHGMSCIFHSKRPLVSSYFQHLGKDAVIEGKGRERGLYLREEKREDIFYPIYEDQSGTHIMSAEDICILENLDEIMDQGLDSLRIEALLKSADYNVIVIKAYREAIDLYSEDPDAFFERLDDWKEQIEAVQDAKRPLSTGFYFKELVF